jgi:hypothetical protein
MLRTATWVMYMPGQLNVTSGMYRPQVSCPSKEIMKLYQIGAHMFPVYLSFIVSPQSEQLHDSFLTAMCCSGQGETLRLSNTQLWNESHEVDLKIECPGHSVSYLYLMAGT